MDANCPNLAMLGEPSSYCFVAPIQLPWPEVQVQDSSFKSNLRLLTPNWDGFERRALFWTDEGGRLTAYAPSELLRAFERGEVGGQTRVRIQPDAPSKPLRVYIRELVWLAYRAAAEHEEHSSLSNPYEAAFDKAPIGMVLSDLAGRIQQVNQAFCEMLGYESEQLVGMRVGEISDSEGREEELVLGNQVLAGERHSFEIEKKFISAAGDFVETLLSISMIRDEKGQPIRVVAHVLDLRRRKQLERELVQSERLKSIGKLAGGIAHDFNNLLQVLLGVTSSLRDGDHEDREEAIEEIELAVHSGARLTRQLMAFARQGIVHTQVIDLNKQLTALQPMLRTALGRGVRLVFDLTPKPLFVEVDPLQLEQVVMNVVFNAAKAMPDGGLLAVATRVLPNDQLLLTITDDGFGMDEETCARAFEPYFTTRSGRGGTGLGLAMVHGLVARFGGSIRLDSQLGSGTTCSIVWPHVQPDTQKATTARPVDPARPIRALVVDDEVAILRNMVRTLKQSSYTVESADSREAALALIAQAEQPYDLLVCDVCLGDEQGKEVVDTALRRWPDLPVLYISGFTDTGLTRADLRSVRHDLLHKPFVSGELLSRVEALLSL